MKESIMEDQPIYPMKDSVALVPAAGLGTRLGLGPKAFLKLGGLTLLRRVVLVLSKCVGRILVAVPATHLEQAQQELKELAEIYVGGATHHETFFKLLQYSHENIILHHHVARPFASQALIRQIVMAMCEYEAVGSFIPPQIPVGCVQGEFVTGALSRMACFLPQSPHAFRREMLEKAYQYATIKGIETQAPWELVFLTESKIKIIEGEEQNIKITTPLDWEIAKKVIAPSLGWI